MITVDPRRRDYGEKEEEEEEREVVSANCLTLIHEAGHAVAYQILRNRGESRSWNHELQSWYEAEDRLLKEYGISSEEIHDVSVYARENPAESMAELYLYMFAGGSRQMPDSLRLKFARLLRDNLPEHKLLPHDENLLEIHGRLPLSQERAGSLEEELLEKINKRKIYPVVHDGSAIVYPDGRQEWRQNGKLSRRDGPAVIHPDGSEEWWAEGVRHREDGPAIVHPDGSEAWYWQGKLHREDGPAIVHPDGREEWRQNGKLSRRDGPAIIHADGSEEWYVEYRPFESVGLDEDQGFMGGELHREDGPSITRSDGSEAWYRQGELHREDGPAIVHPDGREEWWLHGQEASFFEKIKIKRKQMLS